MSGPLRSLPLSRVSSTDSTNSSAQSITSNDLQEFHNFLVPPIQEEPNPPAPRPAEGNNPDVPALLRIIAQQQAQLNALREQPLPPVTVRSPLQDGPRALIVRDDLLQFAVGEWLKISDMKIRGQWLKRAEGQWEQVSNSVIEVVKTDRKKQLEILQTEANQKENLRKEAEQKKQVEEKAQKKSDDLTSAKETFAIIAGGVLVSTVGGLIAPPLFLLGPIAAGAITGGLYLKDMLEKG
jgi:hypothetical protein